MGDCCSFSSSSTRVERLGLESDVVYEENSKVAFSCIFHEEDGKKELCTVGVRRRSLLGIVGAKLYAFGIYADLDDIKALTNKHEFEEEVSEEMYGVVMDADMEMTVKLVVVFGGLTMHMVRKIFNDNLGSSIKKLTTSDHGDLLERVLGNSKEDIKLPVGSLIYINKLPGYVLQIKVKGEIVSEVKSQLLCKAFFDMYLGDEPIDPQAKAKFGQFLKSKIFTPKMSQTLISY